MTVNLLITGPPGSGKSAAALARFCSLADSYLITPTATMAEHLRHRLARSGIPVRPSRVGTLAHFLDNQGWRIPPAAPQSLLHFVVSEALKELRPSRFAPTLESPELTAALVALIEEMPDELPPAGVLPNDLLSLLHYVRQNLTARGYARRNRRLRIAAARIREGSPLPAHVAFDGFFTLREEEIEFVESLSHRSAVTLTLPEFSGAEPAKYRMQTSGFVVQVLTRVRRQPSEETFSSTTCEREAEEIARQILDMTAKVRRFRDIGITLRSRDPYAPLLETTLARFNIPFRSYFADPLIVHPAIAFITGIIRTMLGDWDHAAFAALLRMPVSGLGATPAGDRLDFELREKMPGSGRQDLSALPLSGIVESWRTERHSLREWAKRLSGLRRIVPAANAPETTADRDQIYAWRSTAAALAAFEESLNQTAQVLGHEEPMALEQFWSRVETTLALQTLRVEDRRRDVVHIMDVFESRQWELPIVFICGLLEKVFPRYHREDSLLSDSIRVRLGLSTAAGRQQEERFLFELAKTRATEKVTFSYARFNEKGEETIRSFFLEDVGAGKCDKPVCPASSRAVPPPPSPAIRDPFLTKQLMRLHRKLSPSSIEVYLQCPFQFFASKTLELRARPPAPRDRLNLQVQGQIIHAALAEWSRFPLLGAEVLNRVFVEECARLRTPKAYRTEAVRLELLRHFERFLAAPGARLNWTTLVEQPFRFELRPGLTMRGRIDRLETDRDNRTLVIDYKYSAGQKIRERVDESAEGNLVQAGLYMLAAERAFGLVPAGMLYCGLKKDVSWGGWHLSIPDLESIGNSCLPEVLRELMDGAARIAIEVHDAIISGHIAVQPRDRKKCDWCDYRDGCRVETIPAEVGAGAT